MTENNIARGNVSVEICKCDFTAHALVVAQILLKLQTNGNRTHIRRRHIWKPDPYWAGGNEAKLKEKC